MKDQIISFETAKLAKEKGFDWEITQKRQVYDIISGKIDIYINSNQTGNWNSVKYINICSAPTQSLLQKWLREKHKMDVLIYLEDIDTYTYHVWGETGRQIENWDTYEKALEKGLQEALKLIIKK